MKDLYNNVNIIRAVSPVAVGTTGTGKTSGHVDLKNYESAVVEFSYGAITATDAVFTATVLEADATGDTFTSVADADLIGTEANAGVAAAASRTSGVSMNITKRIGYIGAKRYIKGKVVSTVTAGTPIGINVLRGNPRHAPATA